MPPHSSSDRYPLLARKSLLSRLKHEIVDLLRMLIAWGYDPVIADCRASTNAQDQSKDVPLLASKQNRGKDNETSQST